MNLSRRELLAAFLGAPLAAALHGCGASKSLPPLPPGELIGASDTVGHRLRTTEPTRPADAAWTRTDVCIVGGGIAGLSSAWRFAQSGFTDFQLVELEPETGGTSRSGRSAVTGYPWGAHYTPAPLPGNKALIRLLAEIGAVEGYTTDGAPVYAERMLVRDPSERIFFRGEWYEGLYLRAGASPDDLAQLAAFHADIDRWSSWRDTQGRRAFAIPTAHCSDDVALRALDKLSMAAYLDEHGWTSERLRWYVDYACRDDYGLTLDQTSAWAGLFYFVSRKKSAETDAQPLLTWPEGNGRLATHLAKSAQGRVRTGVIVRNIVPPPEDAAGETEVWCESVSGEVFGFRAKRVIYAAPQFTARFVLAPYREKPPEFLNEFRYGAWMVANLHLDRHPRGVGFETCWDNVLYESPALGYVVATHQHGQDQGPTVLTYYYPLLDDDPKLSRARLLSNGRDEWAEIALADLGRAHPEMRAEVKRLDVMRWGHAMIQPRPSFVWSGARTRAAKPCRTVHFAHSDLSGVALFEEAFHQGLRAAEEVFDALGRPPAERLA